MPFDTQRIVLAQPLGTCCAGVSASVHLRERSSAAFHSSMAWGRFLASTQASRKPSLRVNILHATASIELQIRASPYLHALRRRDLHSSEARVRGFTEGNGNRAALAPDVTSSQRRQHRSRMELRVNTSQPHQAMLRHLKCPLAQQQQANPTKQST